MDFFGAYITIFFVIFLVFPTLFMCIKLLALCCYGTDQRRVPANNLGPNVRQAPVYTITSDPRGNDTISNFPDFFWNVPAPNTGSNEPAKDDKDLPTYEEVIRMEMARQVTESATQAPITVPVNTNTGSEAVLPVRLPV